VTTAPDTGQPAAAFPVAPPTGRTGLVAVPALVIGGGRTDAVDRTAPVAAAPSGAMP
jgi:hypothetical protein